jgi:hypothetical protein
MSYGVNTSWANSGGRARSAGSSRSRTKRRRSAASARRTRSQRTKRRRSLRRSHDQAKERGGRTAAIAKALATRRYVTFTEAGREYSASPDGSVYLHQN